MKVDKYLLVKTVAMTCNENEFEKRWLWLTIKADTRVEKNGSRELSCGDRVHRASPRAWAKQERRRLNTFIY